MAVAPAAPGTAVAPKKGPNPAVAGLKKGLEKANEGQKALRKKLTEAREGGRYGRAAVDTLEAGVGGGIAGAIDGAGLVIPIGKAKHYTWIEVELDDKGAVTGFVPKDGDDADPKSVSVAEANRGVETQQMSIPAGLPVGLALVAGGAHWEQADALEAGKGMVAYSVGRLASDAGKAVRALFAE